MPSEAVLGISRTHPICPSRRTLFPSYPKPLFRYLMHDVPFFSSFIQITAEITAPKPLPWPATGTAACCQAQLPVPHGSLLPGGTTDSVF